MIEVKGVQFNYPSGPAFHFPDLSCAAGQHLLVLGQSGKGKTTLLHLLAGMIRPTAGSIHIQNTDISALGNRALDSFRGQHIGIIFQTAHFVNSIDVLDNLMLSPFLSGKKTKKEDALATLERLGVGQKAHEKPASLSVGEQQRCAIARAVFHKPSLILADEPTSALDDANTEQVIAMLEEQAAQTGAALIIVTHDKRLKDRFQKQITL
jgi:putative ABC transport system ATP-binding protein